MHGVGPPYADLCRSSRVGSPIPDRPLNRQSLASLLLVSAHV